MLRSLRSALAILAVLAPPAHAQLVVRVESNGAAVYGAEVAVWSDSGRLAVGRTDGAGILRLPVSRDRTPIAFITARRVGFSPGRLSAPAADSVTLWLTQRTAELPTVAVTSRPLRCPAESDGEAVALWRRAAARYTAGQDTMPFSYLGSVAEESVSPDERGYGDLPTQRILGGVVLWAKNEPAFGGAHSYLYGTYHPPFGPSYEKWTYPAIHGSAAGLFASAIFGVQHSFVVLGHSGEATTLGFCARTRSSPDIDGELEISSDTSMLGARWSFRVPHHADDAGGEATFGVARLDGARYLVAVRGSEWRRVRRDLFDQRRYVLDAWKFGHTPDQAWLGTWHANGDRSGAP